MGLAHEPDDAVQAVDLLVGVAGGRLLLRKRSRNQSFRRLCHVCYQTSDWIAVEGSDSRHALMERTEHLGMKTEHFVFFEPKESQLF